MSSPSAKGKSDEEKLVIVPDACTLGYWSAPIPKRYFTEEGWENPKRPEHFYDLLKYLPKSKVKGVAILDMIGAETFGRAANGAPSDPYFDQNPKAPDYAGLIKLIYEDPNPFFHVVETAQGKALIEVHTKIHELHGTISNYLQTLPEGEVEGMQKDVHKKLRGARKTLSQHRGETLIKDYLIEHKNPTFFVSDEAGALAQVKDASAHNRHGCIYVDNSVGLLNIMTGYDKSGREEPNPADNLLVKKCGFKNSVRPNEMFLHMVDYDRGPKQTVSIPPSKLVTIASSDAPDAIASPPETWLR